jgi:hypothetical protein
LGIYFYPVLTVLSPFPISGDAIPRYIATAGGKIPLHRSNVIGRDGADLILRKPWSQEEVKYPDANPDEYDRPNFSFAKQIL